MPTRIAIEGLTIASEHRVAQAARELLARLERAMWRSHPSFTATNGGGR